VPAIGLVAMMRSMSQLLWRPYPTISTNVRRALPARRKGTRNRTGPGGRPVAGPLIGRIIPDREIFFSPCIPDRYC
jgi:hypothetical protein